VRAAVERMGIAQHELVRPVVIAMPQRVTCLQERAVWTLVDLDALANTHGRGDAREHLGMHSGEGCAVGSLMSRRGGGRPGKTAPPPPQVMRSGWDSWYGNCGRPDLVRHVLADEDHLDRCGRTWPLAAQARNGDEEVQAAHLSRGGVIDGREATT